MHIHTHAMKRLSGVRLFVGLKKTALVDDVLEGEKKTRDGVAHTVFLEPKRHVPELVDWRLRDVVVHDFGD